MARSSTLALRGAAAAIDLREFREEISALERDEAERKREEKRRQWVELELNTMEECAAIEGYESFAAWYDSDQMPSPSKFSTRIEMIRERIQRLRETNPASEIERENQNVTDT